MRLYPICSSSEGNSLFIGTRGHGILVDAGCSFRALKNALSLIETDMAQVEAVFITHEHSDHIKGLEQIIKHTNIPIFASEGTMRQLVSSGKIPADARIFDITKEEYVSADFRVSAFRTSHDAAQSVGYAVTYMGRRVGVCTDTGVVTPEAEAALLGCEAVLLESNHDVDMLRRNQRYGFELKKRILSDKGHLSNEAAARFAEKLVRNGTRHLILGHLSRENNTPETALSSTRSHLEKCGFAEERDYTLSAAPPSTEGQFTAL